MGNWAADSPLKRWAIVFVLLAGSFWLRWQGLGVFPRPGQTADEYSSYWIGLALWDGQRPIAWSTLPSYARQGAKLGNVHWQNRTFEIVRPALDHPPLFNLLAGGAARLMGTSPLALQTESGRPVQLWEIPLAKARLVSLALFCVTFLLLYDLSKRTLGFGGACLTLLFYGCISHVVAHNRLLVSDNLTAPLLLLNLCVLTRYLQGAVTERALAIVTIVAIAAALLSKVVAASQAVAIAGILLLAGKRRQIIYPILGVAVGLAIYLAYGWSQDWSVFRAVLEDQSARFFGFDALVRLVAHPMVVEDPDLNYLLLMGWFGLFAMLYAKPATSILAAPLLYLLGYVFFASVPAIYGWHILPFYPFLCMGLAGMIVRASREEEALAYLAVMALLLPYAFHIIFLSHTGWVRPMRYAYLAAVAGLAGLYFFAPRFRKQTVQYSLAAMVVAALLREVYVVLVDWTA